MITPEDIKACLNKYLSDRVSGSEVVDFIDEAVSTDAVYDYDAKIQAVVLKYQDILSMYVDDPVNRTESSEFYGPDKLTSVISDFVKEMESIN